MKFKTENFEYKNKVRYHVLPVIEGNRKCFISLVGLYPEGDCIYPQEPLRGTPAVNLQYNQQLFPRLDIKYIHELDGADDGNLEMLAINVSARSRRVPGDDLVERLEKIKKELLEIWEIEMKLEKKNPSYRVNDK